MTDKPIIDALADAWASIDGRLDEFRAEKSGEMPKSAMHYLGYYCDAEELLKRLRARGFDMVPTPSANIASRLVFEGQSSLQTAPVEKMEPGRYFVTIDKLGYTIYQRIGDAK